MARHGNWQQAYAAPTATHWRHAFCNMTGAHLVQTCGVRHHDGPCNVRRLWCPEHGVEILKDRRNDH